MTGVATAWLAPVAAALAPNLSDWNPTLPFVGAAVYSAVFPAAMAGPYFSVHFFRFQESERLCTSVGPHSATLHNVCPSNHMHEIPSNHARQGLDMHGIRHWCA
jgi:hypothetical protein